MASLGITQKSWAPCSSWGASQRLSSTITLFACWHMRHCPVRVARKIAPCPLMVIVFRYLGHWPQFMGASRQIVSMHNLENRVLLLTPNLRRKIASRIE